MLVNIEWPLGSDSTSKRCLNFVENTFFFTIHTARVSGSNSYGLNKRWYSRVSRSRSQHISGHKPVRWAAIASNDEPLLSSMSERIKRIFLFKFNNKEYYIFARFHHECPMIWFFLEMWVLDVL
jgi:hypothetical protein